ncbi:MULTISPECIES: uridine kinase [Brochothrix]|uniref:Uridine kinase n=1 Tax=Brochothrix thermosphacta TaxID=2756 RepID=A0A1D2KAC8_BROTH|nr:MULTISPECIES: uridine kinase [Brochothrix]SLN05670.1 Uridine kinase [C1] [Brachybacterium faecium]ANZ94437.1 uridine kinase [Brochothrix thermosphacta]ANZ97260.1 uridine kinase [Brochothrix thermosphacta]ATF26695.1 uridine kinase [Brochothrix thermosphacta]ATH86050.1 uridine kinase [Brochothrix thermosphacta]
MGNQSIVIGITGGTGSGKTSVSRSIIEYFSGKSILMIEQDAYYKDQSHLSFEERLNTNYDHPFAFDTDRFIDDIKALRQGNAIEKPVYDYAAHTRSDKTIYQESQDVIIVEGILVLADERLRDLMDIKVYVDTDDDIRIIRRMLRDIKERGRTIESVVEQYTTVVKPMHNQFIEPTKKYADVIIPEGGENKVAIDLLQTKVSHFYQNKD